MSEEEILGNLKKYIELIFDKNYCNCNELNVISSGKHCDGSKNVAEAIQGLLDLYNKEKKRKDKIKTRQNEYKQLLSNCNSAKDIDRIKALNERILLCDELLEE